MVDACAPPSHATGAAAARLPAVDLARAAAGAKKGPDDAAKNAAIKAELEKQRLTSHVTSLRKRAWDANSTAATKALAYQEERDEQATKADEIQAELDYQALDFGKRCEKIDKARKSALQELEASTPLIAPSLPQPLSFALPAPALPSRIRPSGPFRHAVGPGPGCRA